MTHVSSETITSKLQEYMNKLDRWAARWRILYNAEKTVGIYFTRKRQVPVITITLNNTPIQWKTEVKYLGVTLDRKLVWKQHITAALRKGRAALSVLYTLIGHRSRMSLKNKVLLYTAIIRPALLYGCEVWGAAAPSTLKELQTLQNKILRIVTNAPYCVRNTILHRDLRVERIKTVIQDKALKLYGRAAVSTNPLIRSLGQHNPEAVPKSPKMITTARYEQEWNY